MRDKIEVTYVKAKDSLNINTAGEALKRARSKAEPYTAPPDKMISMEPSKPAATSRRVASERPKIGIKPEQAKTQAASANIAASEEKSKVIVKQPLIQAGRSAGSVGINDFQKASASYAQLVRNRLIDNLELEEAEEEGDIFVSFVISSDGNVKNVSIISEKSSPNEALKAKALEAVTYASPFPRFPKGIVIDEVTFTCQISFLRK